jgi:hypothetical protein
MSTTIPLLPKSFIRILAKVLGGIFVLIYSYCGFIMLQMFIRTAVNEKIKIGSREINPLQEWGNLVGIYQDLGQRAELIITIHVLTQTGSLTSGTRFANTATGMIYTLVGDVELNAAHVSGTVRAVDVGDIGNMDPASIVSFVNPPVTCEKDCTVASITTDGVDEEDTEIFRNNIMVRWASRPQGGAYADYWDWATAVQGVKNAYPYSGWDIPGLPNSGSGTVVVFIEASSGTDGIPSAALLEDVYDYINANESGLANRRPINAYTDLSLVLPITRITFDIIINELTGDDVDALKIDIADGLTDYFLDREPFVTGLSISPRKDVISLMEVMGVIGTIASAGNGIALNVSISIDGTPLEDDYYQLQEGEKAKLGTLTWN